MFRILFNTSGSPVYRRLLKYDSLSFGVSNGSSTNSGSLNISYENFMSLGLKVGDFIYIFYEPNDKFVFSGVLKKLDYKNGSVKISFSDVSFDVLKTVFPLSDEDTSINLIEKIIHYATKTPNGTYLLNLSPNDVPTTRPDGSSFPIVKYSGSKPIRDIISELLSPYATNTYSELKSNSLVVTKPYYWFITPEWNSQNGISEYYLHIRYPEDNYSYVFDLRNESYLSYDLNDDSIEAVSFVIYTAGKNLKNNTIHNLVQDDSFVKNGRTIFKPLTQVGEEIFQREIDAGNIVESDSTSYDFIRNSKFYKVNNTYPFVTSWNETVNSFDDYNDKFENVVVLKADHLALQYVKDKSRLKFTVVVKGYDERFFIGNYVKIITPNNEVFTLRVTGIKVDFSSSRFNTTYTFEEDKAPVGIITTK